MIRSLNELDTIRARFDRTGEIADEDLDRVFELAREHLLEEMRSPLTPYIRQRPT